MHKTAQELRNAKRGPLVVKALKRRFFDAWYVDTRDEAVEQILSLIPKTGTVSWGGSLTISTLGIPERLLHEGITVLDRDQAATAEERQEIMRRALCCDTFLSSSNALSEDGHLVNIDGIGNRVAAMIYGPRQVIVAAGMNKVVKTLEDAIVRARTIAAPLNMQRFSHLKTPCGETGTCADCGSADSICSYLVITRLCKPAGRIKVILIGEDLGF
ncbi:MAG: lactate utilization protein [Treponema sp.]|jgi:L-lactate utilization protein LutB|nr:lactate utilization protein [Treponema sp.]